MQSGHLRATSGPIIGCHQWAAGGPPVCHHWADNRLSLVGRRWAASSHIVGRPLTGHRKVRWPLQVGRHRLPTVGHWCSRRRAADGPSTLAIWEESLKSHMGYVLNMYKIKRDCPKLEFPPYVAWNRQSTWAPSG